jgi:hypothetical protein
MNDIIDKLPVFIFLLFGFIYCFFGYKSMKVLTLAAGGCIGLCLGLLIGHEYIRDDTVTICISLVAGIVGVVLFKVLEKIAVFTISFVAGMMLAPVFLKLIDKHTSDIIEIVIIVLVGIVTGLLALVLEKKILIVFTSITGAFCAITALWMLIHKDWKVDTGNVESAYNASIDKTWWVIIILVGLGIFFQSKKAPSG